MPAQKKIPMRTCIACREEKPKKEMLRIVRNAAGEIRLDLSGKLRGAGHISATTRRASPASESRNCCTRRSRATCPRRCMRASRRSSIVRSKIASYLGFARRAGKLTLGINGTAASRKVFLLVADVTASENSKKRYKAQRALLLPPCVGGGAGRDDGQGGLQARRRPRQGFGGRYFAGKSRSAAIKERPFGGKTKKV